MKTVRLSSHYRQMLATLQQRWGTLDESDTIRRAISVGYDTGWRRCCVCGKGLGPLLGMTGPSDGYCAEHLAEAMREAEEWVPPEPKGE